MENKAFLFYISFYEAIKELPEKDRLKLYEAIAEYGLFGELKKPISGISKACFALIKPQLDANEKRRTDGKKGGRPSAEKPMVTELETSGFENEKPVVLQNSENEKPKEKVESRNIKEKVESKKIKEKVESRKIKEKEKDIETPNGVSCTEPETASAPEADDLPFGEPEPDFMPEPEEPEPPEITLPLNDGTEHPVMQAEVLEWCGLYPAVDVRQELRNMRGWLLSNPTRRKTARGINAFVVSWLQKEQNRGGSAGSTGRTATRRAASFADIYESLKGGGVSVV